MLARLMVGVVVAGVFAMEILVSGTVDFFIAFAGGLLLGWGLGLFACLMLGMVEENPNIEMRLP